MGTIATMPAKGSRRVCFGLLPVTQPHRSRLLDAGDEPRSLAVARLAAHVPELVEGLRVRSVVLADEAPEAHAGDLEAVLDDRLDHVGVERDHLGLLRALALLHLHGDLRV